MATNIATYFGIDFGTTSSAVTGCAVAGAQRHLTHYAERAGRPMPSTVAIDAGSGSFIIGHDAWAKQSEFREHYEYVPSVKRKLGTGWRLETARGAVGPVQVAQMLFRTLRNLVESRSGVAMRRAVVAIPVGFEVEKRRQLRQAAEKSGLEISAFVSEPTAAFFANYKRLKHAHHIAVFDWGGGTLDVSVLRHENGAVYEEATVGIGKAGNDIDELLTRRVHAQVCARLGAHVAFEEMEPKAQDLLRVRCEEAKRSFSTADQASVQLNRYGELGPCRVALEYPDFQELTRPLVDEAVACLKLAVSEAGLDPGSVDCVLMTGGSSNLRPVQERLRNEFAGRLFSPAETAWNVADGAAALCASPGTYRANQQVGIRLSDGSFYGLLHKGDALEGWKQTHTFGLVDSTEQARIVFSGAPDIDGDELSRITLPFPAYNFMQEMLRLDAEVDNDQVFRVTAKSTMRPENIRRVWEYTRLKRYYEIPEEVQNRE